MPRYACRMGISARTMTREIGTALAVLAIYVLTLLMPLHQAAAQQRDLNALGYSTIDAWSVCTQLAQDDDGQPNEAAALSCPAVGVAKHQMAAVLPPPLGIAPIIIVERVFYPTTPNPLSHLPPDHVGQSRAPPVSA